MSAEKHQGASLEGMFPKLTPEQEARLRPVTEKDVLLSPEEAAALSEEERVEMETMRWKQVPPEPPKPPKPPQKPPQKRKKRRRKPPELRTLLLALIILVVAAMVCGAILLGHYTGGSPTGKQKDSGFSDRSDVAGGDDAWNYASEDKEKQETLPAYTGDRTGVTLTLNSTIGKKTLSYQELYQQCLPTTVSIAVENRDGSGSGSGVVLTQDGYIITCAHVIDDQASAEVTTNDGKTYPAQLVGSDAQTDLALLKIDATGLTPAQFGKTEELQVGEEALAIGDPLGATFHGTLTNGILSGINRDVTLNGYSMTLLQTTAALNSGNSGGPLMNLYGQVIGISSAKIVSEQYEGMGFAIPITGAKSIIDDLLAGGYVQGRVRFGIKGTAITQMQAAMYDVPQGFMISEIDEDSCFNGTDVQAYDIITAIDDTETKSLEELANALLNYKPGDTAEIHLFRPNESGVGGEEFTVTVTLLEDKGETQG